MSIKDNYEIKKIDYHTAMKIIVEKHYLHRKCPCTYSFGMFEKGTENLVGVVSYGSPPSPTLTKGICGEEEKLNVIELNRLWVDDSVPKNGESFLIANSMKLVDKEIVVSFADTKEDHIGVVYQATNWVYTGLSAKKKDWKIEGIDKHTKTITTISIEQLRNKHKDKQFTAVERSRKHRYIFFNCGHKRKKELISKLKYKILPYPKK